MSRMTPAEAQGRNALSIRLIAIVPGSEIVGPSAMPVR